MDSRCGSEIGLGLGKHDPLGERQNNRAFGVMNRNLKNLQTQRQFFPQIITVFWGWEAEGVFYNFSVI